MVSTQVSVLCIGKTLQYKNIRLGYQVSFMGFFEIFYFENTFQKCAQFLMALLIILVRLTAIYSFISNLQKNIELWLFSE